jgi:hypothetical protein
VQPYKFNPQTAVYETVALSYTPKPSTVLQPLFEHVEVAASVAHILPFATLQQKKANPELNGLFVCGVTLNPSALPVTVAAYDELCPKPHIKNPNNEYRIL